MFWRKKKYLAKCGHETVLEGMVEAFGEAITTKMPLGSDGTTDYCLRCLGDMAIKCAWCGRPIFIGDPITLYTSSDPWTPPDYAVEYTVEVGAYVGCLRMSCADTGADRAGFWLPDPTNRGHGHVKRVLMLFGQVMMSGETVLVPDATDPKRAVWVED